MPDFALICREIVKTAKAQAFDQDAREGEISAEKLKAALIMREAVEASRPKLALPPAKEGAIEASEQRAERIIEKDGWLEDEQDQGDKPPVRADLNNDCQLEGGEKQVTAPQESRLFKALADILVKHEELRLFKLLSGAANGEPLNLFKIDKGAIQKDVPLGVWQARSAQIDDGSALEHKPEGDIGQMPVLESEKEGSAESDAALTSDKAMAIQYQRFLEALKAAHIEEEVLSEAPKEGESFADTELDKGQKETVASANKERGEKLAKPWRLDQHETFWNKLSKEVRAGIRAYGFDKLPQALRTEAIDLLMKKAAKETLTEQDELKTFTVKDGLTEEAADPLMRKAHESHSEADTVKGRRKIEKDGLLEDEDLAGQKAGKPAASMEHEQQTVKKRRIFDGLTEQNEQAPFLTPRRHDSHIETPETENRLHREPEGLQEHTPDGGAAEHVGSLLRGLLLAYPELEPIITAMQAYGDEKQLIAEGDQPAVRPAAEVQVEEIQRQLNLYQRFWVIGQSNYKDWIILPPHDFDYESDPIVFDVPEREDYNQCVYPNAYYRRIDRHPIPFGADAGREEIGVSIGILVDLVNIYILIWCKFTQAFWGWTGVEAVVGMVDAIHEYLTLETTLQKRQNKAVSEEYDRAFQWLRWNAEAVALEAREDQNLRGNYYVEVLLEQLINYLLDHHFDVLPLFRDVNKMDEWRMAFGRQAEKEIKWVTDKVKGIRHKLLEAKHYQEE